jgi:dihydrofolate reductase
MSLAARSGLIFDNNHGGDDAQRVRPYDDVTRQVSRLRLSITMSLDGYVAGPDQSLDSPLGVGGMQLHEWFFPLRAFREMHGQEGGEINASSTVVEERRANIGATIMGRNMFGPVRGPWPDESWRGWWGENPPYHHPVFVLTHHPRELLEMEGGTTFHFVSDGIESALVQAKDAAQGGDVWLAGGASVVNQYLAAGLVDEIDVSVAPVVLGGGERLFEGVDGGTLELTQIRVVGAPGVTHIRYEVG